VSMLLRKLARRNAPQGSPYFAPSWRGTPHGWRRDVGSLEQFGDGLDAQLLKITVRMTDGVTRRDLLRRAAGVGAVAGLAMTRTLWTPGNAAGGAVALSCYATDPNGVADGACGPSPICSDSWCNSNGNCADAQTLASKRGYGGNVCQNSISGEDNCWTENCCGTPLNRVSLCCDCCTPSGPGAGGCNDCSRPKQKCICRSNIRNC